ncbi:hypothetical protein TASIC1_0001020900 [Trichoderma asperellum]|uniref:Uncharacterized protein n=1 Tax=Trichoderma asperellum TaxID=101201 RepID=A0A6V8QHX1_TRIAP|nr:hypothetical protein TASIC1_0001020900 [Trichoderma asperellum]
MDDHTKECLAIEDTKPAGHRQKINPIKIARSWDQEDKLQALPTKKGVEGSAARRESTKNKQVGFLLSGAVLYEF